MKWQESKTCGKRVLKPSDFDAFLELGAVIREVVGEASCT
jgi:hypothetical protein